ncbi:patatin-like protein 4 [Prosopis cineraria]|uniref:patatin-like protein 4 n=1 Tax=Prosopis cineraria TaxID=364024 RepID=UPI00240FE6BA|nr:patatin-like protein 4 [Prosopis cineraria]
MKPKYSNAYLRNVTREILNQTRLSDSLTNVVITAFDMKQLSPALFSTYKLEEVPQLNALLFDIAIATSAAPTYLPPYLFDNAGKEFNMIDGGVAAINPGVVALSEVATQKLKNPKLFPMMKNPNDDTKILLLSLGCGESAVRNEYSAEDADSWGALKYMINFKTSSSPITEFMFDGNMDMSEYHLASLFQGLNAEDNYLRVQRWLKWITLQQRICRIWKTLERIY